jgi:hypothetical protein
MKWNPFSAKGGSALGGKKDEKDKKKEELPTLPGMPDPNKLGMFQRMAYKRFLAMSPAEREKVIKKTMTPKNVAKHKDEILASLEAMRKAGQMSDDQYRLAKARFGLK